MKKRCCCLLLVLSLVASVSGILPAREARAASLTAKAKVLSLTSVKISVRFSSQVVKWRIGHYPGWCKDNEKYKTLKTLSKSKKSYTVKHLKKNTIQHFEIVGLGKKNGKLKPIIYDYCTVTTGLSEAKFGVYASTDAYCSPKKIILWCVCEGEGMKPKGVEIYRKKMSESDYKKIATTECKTFFKYTDTDVEACETYQYKLRAYGKINGKTAYSGYSEVLTRSAVNKTGKFTSEVIRRDADDMVLKLTSAAGNGILYLGDAGFSLYKPKADLEDDNHVIILDAYSMDGETFSTVGKKTEINLKGGESVYLQFENIEGVKYDLTYGSKLGSGEINYNGWPCFFYVVLDGEGEAYVNMEMIH